MKKLSSFVPHYSPLSPCIIVLFYRPKKAGKRKNIFFEPAVKIKSRALTNREKHARLAAENKNFQEEYRKNRVRFDIGYMITETRENLKITQKELAEMIGTTQSVVARIEAGKQNFTVDTLQKIVAAFGRKIKIEI